MDNYPLFYLLGVIMALVWLGTVFAVVWLIREVAQHALTRARAQDVPDVLTSLARLVAALPWLGHLATVLQGITRTLGPGSPSSSPTPGQEGPGAEEQSAGLGGHQ